MTYVSRHCEFADLNTAIGAAHAHVAVRHRAGRRIATRVVDAEGTLIATVTLGRATAQEAGKEELKAIKLFNRRFGREV